VVSKIADPPAPVVTAKTSYYGRNAGVSLPAKNYFSSAAGSLEMWIRPTLSSYPSWGAQYVARFYDSVHGNQAGIVFNALAPRYTSFKPELYLNNGGKVATIVDSNTIAVQAWSDLVVTWNGAGAATIYVNGSSGSGAQTLPNGVQGPNNVSYNENNLATAAGTVDQFVGQIAMTAIYSSALSSAHVAGHYKAGSSSSDCQALITGGAQGGVPLTFWPLNDATATLKISSVAASSGGVAVYTGSDIPSGLCADSTNPNPVITITGFVKTENNGAFSCKSSAPKTLTLVNTAAVPESNLAQAAYPGAMAEAISRDKAAYTGPAVLDSVAGIPGDTTRTKRAALFGGDTLYSYYLWETDFNGGVTHVSPAAYVANFSTLNASSYNQVAPAAGVPGIRFYTLTRDSSSGCIAQNFLPSQFPINDNGTWKTSACSPAPPARNSTGDAAVPGLLSLGSVTVGVLPSANSHPGYAAYVTDSTSITTEGQACVGGTDKKALAFSNGSVWKCF
jgi:hypothetical protein